jgi:hypothetical protein
MNDKRLEFYTFEKGPQSAEQAQALNDAVFEMASQAYGHLDKARALAPGSSKAVYALLPGVRAAMFLESLRQVDFDPYSATLHEERSHLGLQLKLLQASVMKKI